MDVSVVYEEREIVKIPYTSIPSFFLLLRENGFPFKWDEQNGKIQLLPGLAGKTIFILKETFKAPYSAQRVIKKFIDDISFFLKGSGASIYSEKNLPLNVSADLRIILDMYEDPSIDQPSLTVHHDMKPHNHKWIYILKEECREAGIDFTTNVKEAETQPYMKFLMKVPRSAQPVFTESLNKKFQLIISMGILARFQTNNPLFLLSYLPLHQISFHPSIPNKYQTKILEESKKEKTAKVITESAIPTDRIKPQQDVLEATTDKNELKNSAVEAFFDYQILFDRNKNSKIIVFGNLIIKNTGNTVLQNPIICFQLSPKGNVNFTGQLVPPNIAETRGVVNSEKGWKYMYDDWFQQAEEKGEIWICPIKSINILPGQKESFQNFQISLVKEENQQNLKVEGYVYFQEQGLQYKANNRITLSF